MSAGINLKTAAGPLFSVCQLLYDELTDRGYEVSKPFLPVKDERNNTGDHPAHVPHLKMHVYEQGGDVLEVIVTAWDDDGEGDYPPITAEIDGSGASENIWEEEELVFLVDKWEDEEWLSFARRTRSRCKVPLRKYRNREVN